MSGERRESSQEYSARLEGIETFDELYDWIKFHPEGGVKTSRFPDKLMTPDQAVMVIGLIRSGKCKVDALDNGNGLRDKVASLMTGETTIIKPDQRDDIETMRVKPEILDGLEAGDLADGTREYEGRLGDRIYAGTDKGIRYKDHNEDRVAVDPENGFVAVIDGMGGHSNGDLAAQILAESLLKNQDDIAKAVKEARDKMTAEGVADGGAVFISVKIKTERDEKFIEVAGLGDASLVIIGKNGEVKFESDDDSYVGSLVRSGNITEDEALYHKMRNVVVQAVAPSHHHDTPKMYKALFVDPGDKVLLMSDGVADNLTAEDLAKQVKGAKGMDAVKKISDVTNKRMAEYENILKTSDRKRDGVYSDGFKSHPKRDNRALAMIEIPE